ncbi:MAG TPA: phospho-N-acetylmuramoyl-pentapeptide-transferase [Actinomycetota bacterium]|nr:phospho-N-acetylmuramoyl-pentapeptide-transferase [Actinomycetota bacterium]
MRPILFAAAAGLVFALFATPLAIRIFRAWGFGQRIREAWAGEGPEAHHGHLEKMGTPTMGGLVILGGMVAGYAVSRLVLREVTATALCVFGAVLGLGLIGFLDDFLKIRRQRSLGLNKTAKFLGQALIAVGFAFAAVEFAGASTFLSFIRESGYDLGLFFYVWAVVIFAASSNGVNLTDGLDGLASGSMTMVMAAYVIIAFWQFRHPGAYDVRDALDVAVIAAGALGACAGFLWFNAAPARIFMGDTGSLALGGLAATMAIFTNTHLLLIVIGGLFVLETASVVIQVVSFRFFHRRVFRMAPFHHHFELIGWPEFTVIVRFWIICGLAVAFGLGLFYAEFLGQ